MICVSMKKTRGEPGELLISGLAGTGWFTPSLATPPRGTISSCWTANWKGGRKRKSMREGMKEDWEKKEEGKKDEGRKAKNCFGGEKRCGENKKGEER